jgi:hypothetical protein
VAARHLRPARVVQIEPRRVIVELKPEELSAIGRFGPAVYLRAVALETIRRRG